MIPLNASTVSAYWSAWIQMDYFLELLVNESSVNHAPSEGREKNKNPMSALFILSEAYG
jgi:hypothetical protein